MSVVCRPDPIARCMRKAMLDDVNVRTSGIEVGAERGTHPMWRAIAAEAQALHERIETSVGHWSLRVDAIRKDVNTARRNNGTQGVNQLDGLFGERDPVSAPRLHTFRRNLPLGSLQVDLAPFATDDLCLAAGRQDDQLHRGSCLFVDRVDRIQLAKKLSEKVGGQGRMIFLMAFPEDANRRYWVVLDEAGVDRVLEDSPKVVPQIPRNFGRSCFHVLQDGSQLKSRDGRDRSTLEARCQVLLDLALALQDGCRPQTCTCRSVPIGMHRAEAALHAVQFGANLVFALRTPGLDRMHAFRNQLSRLGVGVASFGQADFREGAERLQAFDAVQPELVAPKLGAVRLDEKEQAAGVRQLDGPVSGLRGLDLECSALKVEFHLYPQPYPQLSEITTNRLE